VTWPADERATEQAWLAPLPPGRRVSELDEMVWPGATMWPRVKNLRVGERQGVSRSGVGAGRQAGRNSSMSANEPSSAS
jgi:hypothetical protein